MSLFLLVGLLKEALRWIVVGFLNFVTANCVEFQFNFTYIIHLPY